MSVALQNAQLSPYCYLNVLIVHYVFSQLCGVKALNLSETDVFAGFSGNVRKHAFSFLCVFTALFCLKL